MTTPNLDKLELAFGRVRAYDRTEHGRVEHVGPSSREMAAMDWWHARANFATPGNRSAVEPGHNVMVGGDEDVPRWLEPGRVVAGAGQIGSVEKRGALWHGTHLDGTETGGSLSKGGAVKDLISYHNAVAAKYRSDPARIAELERSTQELDPLWQMERDRLHGEADRLRVQGAPFAEQMAARNRLLEHIGGDDAVLSAPTTYLDELLGLVGAGSPVMSGVAPGHVRSFERLNKVTGKLEEVRGYERDNRLRPGVIGGEQAQKQLGSLHGRSPEHAAAFRGHLRAARGHVEAGEHDKAIAALESAKAIAHQHAFSMVHTELSRQQAMLGEEKEKAAAAARASHEVQRIVTPAKRAGLFGRKPAFGLTGDTPCLDLIELAQVNVKGFERVVNGKVEQVRPFAENRKGGKGVLPGAPGGGWPHPDAVGGHKVLGVFEHPASPHAMYDLGHGLHAEGKPGAKAGPVMKSTGLDKAALKDKGWTHTKPPAAPAKPAAAKVAPPKAKAAAAPPKPGEFKLRPRAAKKVQAALAQQQQDYMARSGYKVNPKDWSQDWVPPHEDRIVPDLHPSADVKDLNKPGRVGGEGTAADPIDVKGNVSEALRHLAAGHHVRLNRPSELTLLMQEVQRHAAETEAAPKNEKPDWDFGKLSVKGTNLFAAQNKGIRRIHMPQFSGLAQPGTHAEKVAGGAGKFADLTDEFEQHLKDKGIKVTRETMPASHLKATQSELVGSKVAGFADAFLHGNPKAVKAMSEPIMVTKDGYVIDGHHRWGANMLVDAVDGRLGSDTPMNVRKVDMEIGAMIPMANAWAHQVGIASAAATAGDTGPK